MANFRAERLFIRVAGFIDAFDPNEGINAQDFATLMVLDSGTYERDPLSEYTFAPFDKPRWFPASKGLKTVRALIEERQLKLNACEDEPRRENLRRDIETLRVVEDRLDMIDIKDVKFHFLARDLE